MDKRLEVDTLIFDLDGTLLDTLTDLATAVNFALRSHGLPERSRAEIRLMLGNGVRRLMRDAAPVDLTNEQFEGIFSTFRDYYMEHCLDTTSPYEGIIPLLSALCEYGFRLGIVSNKLDSAVQELNTRFFSQYIDVAVGESPTVRRKPCPDSVIAAVDRLGSKPERALYIGDSEVDIATARAAGIPIAVVLWGFRDEEFLRTFSGEDTYFITTPGQLLDLVR